MNEYPRFLILITTIISSISCNPSRNIKVSAGGKKKSTEMVTLFHGTDGATLLPSLEISNYKLMSYGKLKSKGLVPFNGENSMRITDLGGTQTSISAFDAKHQKSFSAAKSYGKPIRWEMRGNFFQRFLGIIGMGKTKRQKIEFQDKRLEADFKSALAIAKDAVQMNHGLSLYWVSNLHTAASKLKVWNPNLYNKLLSDTTIRKDVNLVKNSLNFNQKITSRIREKYEEFLEMSLEMPMTRDILMKSKSVEESIYVLKRQFPQPRASRFLGNIKSYFPKLSNLLEKKVLEPPAPKTSNQGKYGMLRSYTRQFIDDLAIWNQAHKDAFLIIKGKLSQATAVKNFMSEVRKNAKEMRAIFEPAHKNTIRFSDQQKEFMLSGPLPIVLEGRVANGQVSRQDGQRQMLTIKQDLGFGTDIHRIHVSSKADKERVMNWLASKTFKDRVDVVISGRVPKTPLGNTPPKVEVKSPNNAQLGNVKPKVEVKSPKNAQLGNVKPKVEVKSPNNALENYSQSKAMLETQVSAKSKGTKTTAAVVGGGFAFTGLAHGLAMDA